MSLPKGFEKEPAKPKGTLPKGSDGTPKMGKGTKIAGIVVLSFIILFAIGYAYEDSTGLNMITGEKKTSGVGADKWGQSSSSGYSSNSVYDVYDRKTSECSRYGSPGNFASMDHQFAWNDCMNSANSWLNNNLP
jgi:hypothetical protein